MIRRLPAAARSLTLLAAVLAVMTILAPRPARAAGEVGTVAPDFTFTNLLAGPTTVSLSQYAGSVVVIAFVAYW